VPAPDRNSRIPGRVVAKHLISIVITVNEMADASIHSAPRALRGRRA
jgi:hypothetical protein